MSDSLQNGGEASPFRHWASISYNSKDKRWGRWLHRAIETYGIPAQLVSHPTPAGHPAANRCRPYFVGLLGERYGWVPRSTPNQLLEDER
jgi:hypothetical protein